MNGKIIEINRGKSQRSSWEFCQGNSGRDLELMARSRSRRVMPSTKTCKKC